jgi:uncharacterized protein (TIGR03435 family)
MGQMPESDDHRLLAEFVRGRSETAFTELVRRYAGLVHSTAFRFCGNPHHAEEIAQAVFVILARKAGTLSPRVVVSGWLYQTARLTAANFVKGEMRRRRREQEAVMQSNLLETDPTDWGKIAPLLDDAMGALGETDRNAVLLRYFENRTSSEIGVALRMNEETARKRVNRALEKLRHFFMERGVTVSSAALSGAISANSVQPVSAFMVKSISAVALAKGAAASTSTLTLIKGALKIMAWTKAKLAAVAVTAVILATGTTTVIVKHFAAGPAHVSNEAMDDSFFEANGDKLASAPPNLVIVRPTHSTQVSGPLSISGHKGMAPNTIRMSGRCVSFESVLGMAYNVSPTRMILPADVPEGNLDFLVTVSENQREKLQAEIKKQFGVVGRREVRDTDVLVLKLRTRGAPGLKRGTGGSSTSGYYTKGATSGRYAAKNAAISLFADFLEQVSLKRIVIDQTGLSGTYNFELDASVFDSEQALNRALLTQLGLELVPSREPVEMLVVEKAN